MKEKLDFLLQLFKQEPDPEHKYVVYFYIYNQQVGVIYPFKANLVWLDDKYVSISMLKDRLDLDKEEPKCYYFSADNFSIRFTDIVIKEEEE